MSLNCILRALLQLLLLSCGDDSTGITANDKTDKAEGKTEPEANNNRLNSRLEPTITVKLIKAVK